MTASPRPLFLTGTARSGSTLLAKMLDAHAQVAVASDPCFPLFRSMRDAIASRAAVAPLSFVPGSPFQDYYFGHERLALMDAVQEGSADLRVPQEEWKDLRAAVRERAAHECPDLVARLAQLTGSTYADAIRHALQIIAEERDPRGSRWVGLKEVWIVELFKPLARAFPDARFVILLRDPRATVNSDVGASGNDAGAGDPLSLARNWRKHIAFATRYGSDPLFEGRLLVIWYEQILRDPARAAERLCRFLEIDADPAMLDTSRYRNAQTGRTWEGNSSFGDNGIGFRQSRAEHWRGVLDPAIASVVEFTCAPEIRLFGTLWPEPEDDAEQASPDLLEHFIALGRRQWNWRSDLGDPLRDYGAELVRRALLGLRRPTADTGLIRQAFLFEDVYAVLRGEASAGFGDRW